jgi:hypothetical protein
MSKETKYYRIGEGEDVIKFSYATNSEALDLDKIKSQLLTSFLILPYKNGGSENKNLCAAFDITNNSGPPELKVEYHPNAKRLEVILSGPMEDLQKEAIRRRSEGEEIKTLGSLIVRSIYAAAARDGNIFLHGTGLVDEGSKTFYVILSNLDHAGKSVLTNEFLKDGPVKPLSTALRMRVRDTQSYAYPQLFGAEAKDPGYGKVYTELKKEEIEIFKSKTSKTLQDIGIEEVQPDDKVLAPGYSLNTINAHPTKVCLNQYHVAFVFVDAISANIELPRIYPLTANDALNKLVESWVSRWRFGANKLFGTIDCTEFDSCVAKGLKPFLIDDAGEKKYADKLLCHSKPYLFAVYDGPFKIWEKVVLQMCKQDFTSTGDTLKRHKESPDARSQKLANWLEEQLKGTITELEKKKEILPPKPSHNLDSFVNQAEPKPTTEEEKQNSDNQNQ